MAETILFFDTETTGFAKFNRPASDPSQPHIVQLAARLVTSEQVLLHEFSSILCLPEGAIIPDQAAAVHGISTARANGSGIPPKVAMRVFMEMFNLADILVAHNLPFDLSLINSASYRYLGGFNFDTGTHFCTMRAATPVVKAPPTDKMKAAGRTHYKSPKLEECIRHFFDEDLEGAHDAMVDAIGCERVYFELKRLGKA